MNWDTMLKVVMSMIFFAPLLMALAFFLLLGVLMLFEGLTAFARRDLTEINAIAKTTAAPRTGPIVAALEEAIGDEAERKAGKAPGSEHSNASKA